jgi:hypothetical protein
VQRFVGHVNDSECLCGLGMANTCWYKCVDCWPVSMASSESAVWLALVGWSMRVHGSHWVWGGFMFCSNPVGPFGLGGGPGSGIL